MTGHCVVLLLSTLFDHYGSPGMFYLLWIIFGGLSGLKLVSESESISVYIHGTPCQTSLILLFFQLLSSARLISVP